MNDELDERTEAAGTAFPGIQKREPLPWVLFITTLVLFMISTVVLVNRTTRSANAHNAALDAQGKAEAQEKAAKAALEPLKDKIEQLEGQLKAVTAEREALADKVKALELAKKATAAPPPPKKKVTAPPKKKKRK